MSGTGSGESLRVEAGQLTFDLTDPGQRGFSFFLNDESNQEAYDLCDGNAKWPGSHLFLSGPELSGKSLLARAAQENGAGIVEDLDQHLNTLDAGTLARERFERDLFHRLNWAYENNGRVLITSRKPAVFLEILMPDLRSRLLAMHQTTIALPSDILFRKLLVKHFSDRQVRIDPPALDYLTVHTERSHKAAKEIPALLDREALRLKKKINVPFIRRILQNRV